MQHLPACGTTDMEDCECAQLQKLHWRCFHCDEVYHLKRRLERYQQEDTELHREIARLRAAHRRELEEAGETGYARGLRDARLLPPTSGGSQA